MTPKEKAKELVDGFRFILIKSNTDAGEEILCTLLAKQCALIAVDEIIKMLMSLYKPEYTSFNTVNELMYKFEEGAECDVMDGYEMVMYYDEVKQEIVEI